MVSLGFDITGIAVVRVSEGLSGEDYERVAPRLDRCRRILVEVAGDFDAAGSDTAWSAAEPPGPSRGGRKRVALVAQGDPDGVLERTFRQLFPEAEIRRFVSGDRALAETWLLELRPLHPLPPAAG